MSCKKQTGFHRPNCHASDCFVSSKNKETVKNRNHHSDWEKEVPTNHIFSQYDVYWTSKFILNLSALQKCLQPQPLPTILNFYSLFSRYLNFPRWEGSKGSPGNWQVRLSSSNSGQSCDPSEHMVSTVQVGISDLICVGTSWQPWVPTLLHSCLVTSPFHHTPLHPPDNRSTLMSSSSSLGISYWDIKHMTHPDRALSVDPSDCLQGSASREPCSPAAGDLWSRLHCGTVNKLHSATLVLVTEQCLAAWISPPLLWEKRKTKERIGKNQTLKQSGTGGMAPTVPSFNYYLC